MRHYDEDILNEIRKEIGVPCISDIPARWSIKDVQLFVDRIPKGIYSDKQIEEAMIYCAERKRGYEEAGKVGKVIERIKNL